MREMSRLRPMIAMDLIVACYLLSLTREARARPQAMAGEWFDEAEQSALKGYFKLERSEKLTLGQTVGLIGRLGGHLARKNDGPPGPEVIWRGLQKLQPLTTAWLVFSNDESCG